MATLKTKYNVTMAAALLDGPTPKERLNQFVSQVLELLPRNTSIKQITEVTPPPDSLIGSSFEVEFDAPFFAKDFEFTVERARRILSDGVIYHQYQVMTDIVPLLPLKDSANANSNS